MKFYLRFSFATLLIISLISQLNAQISADSIFFSEKQSKVKTLADSMSFYFMNNEFEKYIKFHHPDFIKIIGGEKVMLETLHKNMIERGMKALQIENKIPEKIFKTDSLLQCTFTQISLFQLASKKMEIVSCILAISYNNGKDWLFFNTAGLSRKRIKEIFPQLNDELIITEQKTTKLN